MSESRYRRSGKVKVYNASMDTFVERLRKARGLNIDPGLFGMNNESMKKFSFHKVELLTKHF
ncbi:MAG: hypothetical protein WC512_07260 [Candidatus Omnitrophota bacterium]